MEIAYNNYFYVVHFLNPPYREFDKYVCIPGSWVQMHDESKDIVVTKYPVENASKTEQRVKESDASSIDWSFYTANFKYRANSYEEAKEYIETIQNGVAMKRNYPELINEDGDGSLLSSSTGMDKSQIATEQTPLTHSETKIRKKQAPVVKSVTFIKKLPNQAPTYKQLPSTPIRNNSNVKPKNVGRSEINKNTGDKTGNESFGNNNTPKSAITKLPAQSTPINNHLADRDYDSTVTTSKDTVALEVQDIEREKEIQVIGKTQVKTGVLKSIEVVIDEREDDHDNQDSTKNKYSEPRRINLPPEFDENDPTWTLRYRKPSPELVELMEGTDIYVNAAKLFNFQRSSRDAKSLARMLLTEIFTDNALRTCVYTAGPSSGRPGLYDNANTVLLDYVERYEATNNWPKVGRDSIIARLREKLRNMKK